VQAQKWIEGSREKNRRRVTIFRTLMATRGSILSPAHVESLNVVPIEFHGKNRSFVAVVDAWKSYIDYLYNKDQIDQQRWAEKRVELLTAMLVKMASALGYNFNSVEITRELYSPKGHAAIKSDQEIIRQGLARVFRGEMAFPMAVQSFPTDREFIENQTQLQTQLLRWLAGEPGVKVVMASDETGTGAPGKQ
jgi:hypothetical protein